MVEDDVFHNRFYPIKSINRYKSIKPFKETLLFFIYNGITYVILTIKYGLISLVHYAKIFT